MYTTECVVVGAGVIGLAIARALALARLETVVVERCSDIGSGTSSRNSEVIHAGIYYPFGSRKATTCVRGRELLYSFCLQHGIPHRRCGKLIVATDDGQLPTLQAIKETARRNGVVDLELLGRDAARRLEPEVDCRGALHSPSTGIVDSHEYLQALEAESARLGVSFAFNTDIAALAVVDDGIMLTLGDDDTMRLRTRWLVNASGLDAPAVASRIAGFPPAFVPRAYFAKGNYYRLRGRNPFSRLVYPVPVPGGLGIHLTMDLAGRARFGPDVEWVDAIGYDVDPARSIGFYSEIRKYWPALPDDALEPDYAGIRPKLAGPGESAADFRIDGPAVHRVPGVINLFGIESPGLTASLAIAEEVAGIMRGG